MSTKNKLIMKAHYPVSTLMERCSLFHSIFIKNFFVAFIFFVVGIFNVFAKTGEEIIRENGLKTSVSPLMSTHWSQDGGENCMLPETSTGDRMKAGCGPVATAQIMNFWKYPEYGVSGNYYIWEKGHHDYNTRIADFSSAPYDWDNMADIYKTSENVSDIHLTAIGKLMYDLGVALEVKYDENLGTPTQIEYIHSVLKRFFGYNHSSVIMRMKNGYDIDEWRAIIYRELSEGRPVLMGGDFQGVRHIYVADGYDKNGLIHMNMGHADINRPNHDTYYDLTEKGVTYTDNMRMIVGITPYSFDIPVVNVNVESAGTLIDAIAEITEPSKVCRIKISGTINNADIKTLNRMTMTDSGQLSFIDMSECSVEDDSLPDEAFSYGTEGNNTLQEIILPMNLKHIGRKAFMNCGGLYKVTLPEGLKSIADYAFSNCRYLDNILIPASLENMGANPFRYCKMDYFEIASGNDNFDIVDSFLTDISHKILYSAPLKPSGMVSIPEGIEQIYSQAFIRCPLISGVTMPTSLKNIGSWAFSHCYFIEDIYSHNRNAPSIRENSFEEARLECNIHVPVGSIQNYLNEGWDIFYKIIEDIGDNSVNTIEGSHSAIVGVYTLSGIPLQHVSQPGAFIVTYADGTSRKCYLRNNTCLDK